MDGLLTLVVVAAAIFILIFLVSWRIRAYMENKPQLDEQLRQHLEAELLEAIKDASPDQGMSVNIQPFWRGSGIPSYQQNAVIKPLIRSGHVKEPPSAPSIILELYNSTFLRPITHLQLTDRTWQRMVLQGISGTTIVIEKGGAILRQTQKVSGKNNVAAQGGADATSKKAAGDVTDTSAGGDAQVQAGHGSSRRSDDSEIAGVSTSELVKLVEALREDAAVLNGVDRKKARELANKLESELEEDEIDEDSVEDSVGRAGRFVERTSGLMKATAKLLTAFGLLRGGGE